ncbi:MAG: flavodoxin family protein [Deltaproteobacteria bacterium]|jgi:multimeric flavodoxin WrbA|nr:flavodoxin family protein [Deltaproteobacteria bacterium]
MKVVAIFGSPRAKSNSTILGQAAVLATGSSEASSFFLNDLSPRGCQACWLCKTETEVCVLKDDLAPILAAAAQADFIILTSPIFIGDVSAQLKIFIDRTFSWYKSDFKSNPEPGRLPPGKKLLLITSQFNPDPVKYASCQDYYVGYFRGQGFKADSLVAADIGLLDVTTEQPELLEEVARKVAVLLKD